MIDAGSCFSGGFGKTRGIEDYATGSKPSQYRVGYCFACRRGEGEHPHFQVSRIQKVFTSAAQRPRKGVAGMVDQPSPSVPTIVQGLQECGWMGLLL